MDGGPSLCPHRGRPLAQSRRQWVNGEQPSIDGANAFAVHAAHRMSLLWRPEPGFEAHGRLYHFSGRGTTADRPWSEQFITMEAPVPRNRHRLVLAQLLLRRSAQRSSAPERAGSATISPTPSACTRKSPSATTWSRWGSTAAAPARTHERLQRCRVHPPRGAEPFAQVRVAADRGCNPQLSGACSCEVGFVQTPLSQPAVSDFEVKSRIARATGNALNSSDAFIIRTAHGFRLC